MGALSVQRPKDRRAHINFLRLCRRFGGAAAVIPGKYVAAWPIFIVGVTPDHHYPSFRILSATASIVSRKAS